MEPVCVLGQRKSRWLTVVVWLWFDRLTILSEVEGVMGLTVVLSVTQTRAVDGSIRAVTCLTTCKIQQAGNADSDKVRLDYLRKLQKKPGLDASFKEDLTKPVTRDPWLATRTTSDERRVWSAGKPQEGL